MVDLSLFTDWSYCSACGLPSGEHCVGVTPRRPSPPKKKKLMMCADCGCVAYHNSACQRSHWKSHHRRECRELARAIIPLRELIRWHNGMHDEKAKKDDSSVVVVATSSHLPLAMEGGEEASRGDVAALGIDAGVSVDRGLKRVRCWWEPNNENGITEEAVNASCATWRRSARMWQEGEYLAAMEGFQNSLEPYRRAWPCIGKSTGTNERREDDMDGLLDRSIGLAKKLLFCAYCELDASQVDSARQRLVQCLSITITMTIFSTSPSRASKKSIRNVMNDAWMELMLSMEEIPQHRIIARHVAALAITTNSCGWTDPLQRPGYMARVGLSGIPYTPPEEHPSWCRIIENNWIPILNEYSLLTSNPLNLSNVGSGQRGSGHDDHLVVSGRSWKEYVLFGTGSKGTDNDAPFTKRLLRSNIPDAVSFAEQGGGEVIFSCLSPRTHINAHCGPTNLRWTAHLGLVIPDSADDCQIRVRDIWHSWTRGKILLFDDSYEHEVRNDTDETRVVLLIRLWHPELQNKQKSLSEAMTRKEDEVRKRYHPPI